jgi:hypothetical protein
MRLCPCSPQEYLTAWKALASLSGLPEEQIYDTRGNHDTFNSGARCVPYNVR